MESRKRPNEDMSESLERSGKVSETQLPETAAIVSLPEAEAVSQTPPIAQASPATVAAAVMVTEKRTHGELDNKRIKLAQESEKSGADYSPSGDIADPTKEVRGLADWIDRMDEEDNRGPIDAADIPTRASGTVVPEPTKDKATGPAEATETTVVNAEAAPPTVSLQPLQSASDLIQLLTTPIQPVAVTETSELNPTVSSDSTLADSSDPNCTGSSEPDPAPTLELKPKDTITTTQSVSNSAGTNIDHDDSILATLPMSESSMRVNQKHSAPVADSTFVLSMHSEPVPTLNSGTQPGGRSVSVHNTASSSEALVAAELTSSTPQTLPGVSTAATTERLKQIESEVSNAKQNHHNGDDVIMAMPRITTPDPQTVITGSDNRDFSAISKFKSAAKESEAPRPVDSAVPNVTEVQSESQSTSKLPISQPWPPVPTEGSNGPAQSEQAGSRNYTSSVSIVSTREAETDIPHQRQSSLPHTLPPLSSLAGPGSLSSIPTQPTRSNMSLSALLSQDDPEPVVKSRHTFDAFKNSPRNSPSPPPAGATRPTQGRSATHFDGDFQELTPKSEPQYPRIRNSYIRNESPPPHMSASHPESLPPSSRSTVKEYPADEVMESGDVGGYNGHHHRTTYPSHRPRQDVYINMTESHSHQDVNTTQSIPVGSRHERHAAPGPAAPISQYSAQQSPVPYSNGASHPIPPVEFNGHHVQHRQQHISGHHVSQPIMTPRRPRLVVKNDESLRMEDRAEDFLGYFQYIPGKLLPALQGKENCLLDVRVPSTYLTYDNPKVKRREIWGTDVYTDDSDVVAMIIHAGHYIPPTSSVRRDQDSIQPVTQHHNFIGEPLKAIRPSYDLSVTLRVLPRLMKYASSIRNRINSRTWDTEHDGASLHVEGIRKLGLGEALNRGRRQGKLRMREYTTERQRVLSNIHDEYTESLQNERSMRTATFEFTHQGDPCFKYSPELVMDRHDGLSEKWTSWRLKKEVLILENDEERYEISLQHQAGTDSRRFDQYRFAVISPRISLSSWSKSNYPLQPTDLSEILYEGLDWQDFEWVERGVVVQPNKTETPAVVDSARDESQGGSDVGSVSVSKLVELGRRQSSSGISRGEQVKASGGGGSGNDEDGQQEGVFCVVSRLFWRPITEKTSRRDLHSSRSGSRAQSAVPYSGAASSTTPFL